eukprot:scaffold1435_cov267-Pinguiococcus_pyrenoidosus.AAC.29
MRDTEPRGADLVRTPCSWARGAARSHEGGREDVSRVPHRVHVAAAEATKDCRGRGESAAAERGGGGRGAPSKRAEALAQEGGPQSWCRRANQEGSGGQERRGERGQRGHSEGENEEIPLNRGAGRPGSGDHG